MLGYGSWGQNHSILTLGRKEAIPLHKGCSVLYFGRVLIECCGQHGEYSCISVKARWSDPVYHKNFTVVHCFIVICWCIHQRTCKMSLCHLLRHCASACAQQTIFIVLYVLLKIWCYSTSVFQNWSSLLILTKNKCINMHDVSNYSHWRWMKIFWISNRKNAQVVVKYTCMTFPGKHTE